MEKTNESAIPEEKFRRMVFQLSLKYWLKLPVSVRSWLDTEDLAQECMLLIRRRLIAKYDGRASLSTYLHVGVENYLRNLCEFYTTPKRFTPALDRTDEDGGFAVPYAPSNAHLAYLEAANGLRCVYANASFDLQEELRHIFNEHQRSVRKPLALKLSNELRNLAAHAKLKADDFRLLLSSGYVIA